MTIKRILREPLFHFFLAGAVLFAVYAALDNPGGDSTQEIVVDEARVQALRSNFERTWQRPPSDAELRSMVDSWVDQELLYREGMALGFDRDDPVVKRRVAQKVGFLVESANSKPPDEAELAAWLESHGDRYQVPASYSFEQVYYDPDRQGASLTQNIQSDLESLSAGGTANLADSTMLPAQMAGASSDQVADSFGAAFAEALAIASVGQWAGPVQSAYGTHLVRVGSTTAQRSATLDEVRAEVERDLLAARQDEAERALLEQLRDQYDVRIEAALP